MISPLKFYLSVDYAIEDEHNLLFTGKLLLLYTGKQYISDQPCKQLRFQCIIQIEAGSVWCNVNESACQARDARDTGLVSGSGRSPGVGNGNPIHYSCLENSINRGAWWAIVLGCKGSDTTELLSSCISVCTHTNTVYTWNQLSRKLKQQKKKGGGRAFQNKNVEKVFVINFKYYCFR